MQFTPNQATPIVDPAVQFIGSGNDTVAFQIAAGQTSAVFTQSSLVQVGTIAGTVVLTANVTAGGVPITLSNSPVTLNLAQEPPGIVSVKIVQVSSGFNVEITGYSNTREITQAAFAFTAQPGSQIQSSTLSPPGVDTVFQAWYASDAATAFGSQFTYTQPFSVTTGTVSTLQSVTVTLTNSQGTSSSMTANF